MTAKKERIHILIADDHSVVREGLVSLVKRKPDMKVVAEASNGREAVDLWKEHRPDITLLDLRMPELDGVGAIKEIRELDENARIVVLTTFDGDEDIYRAIRAGAKGYLLKNPLYKELLKTIRAVHAGKKAISPQASYEIAEHATDDSPTPAEIAALRLIAVGNANKQIADQLRPKVGRMVGFSPSQ